MSCKGPVSGCVNVKRPKSIGHLLNKGASLLLKVFVVNFDVISNLVTNCV
jgi:hypothetical protein